MASANPASVLDARRPRILNCVVSISPPSIGLPTLPRTGIVSAFRVCQPGATWGRDCSGPARFVTEPPRSLWTPPPFKRQHHACRSREERDGGNEEGHKHLVNGAGPANPAVASLRKLRCRCNAVGSACCGGGGHGRNGYGRHGRTADNGGRDSNCARCSLLRRRRTRPRRGWAACRSSCRRRGRGCARRRRGGWRCYLRVRRRESSDAERNGRESRRQPQRDPCVLHSG